MILSLSDKWLLMECPIILVVSLSCIYWVPSFWPIRVIYILLQLNGRNCNYRNGSMVFMLICTLVCEKMLLNQVYEHLANRRQNSKLCSLSFSLSLRIQALYVWKLGNKWFLKWLWHVHYGILFTHSSTLISELLICKKGICNYFTIYMLMN